MFRTRRRRRLVLALVIVLLALVIGFLAYLKQSSGLCCAIPGTLVIAPDAGEFIFMSNRDGDWDIYLMTLPEKTVQNLTHNDVDDGFAAFSSDGEAIEFLSNRIPEEGLTAYIMNADGSNVTRVQNDLPTILNVLTTGRTNWDVTPSRDNTKSVFVSLRDLNLEIYLQARNNDGETSDRNLTNNGAIDWYPALSPDETRIAFASDRDGNQEIYVMNVDGSEVRRLTDHSAYDLYPVWASDNHQIIFYSERDTTLANGMLALYVIDADAENPTPVRLESVAQTSGIADRIPLDVHVRSDGSSLYMGYDGDNLYIMYAERDERYRLRMTDDYLQALFPVWR